ncbi:MAG: metallohydrolase [Acidobacteriota bacterium]
MEVTMTATVSFFPVGNGDTTLVRFASGHTLLIDVNIRGAADDPDDDTPDVATELRKRLSRDEKGRLYVDAFLLSHPDADHCRRLVEHFHLGPPEDFPQHDTDKILIRELWSSPIVFRRATKTHILCDDAKALQTEARRRVKKFRDTGSLAEGDRILILGEDVDGKTDDLSAILVKVDGAIHSINGEYDSTMNITLLAPLPISDDESEEDALSKNESSVILRIGFVSGDQESTYFFLTGGDAEVGIWERLWKKHAKTPEALQYDMLLTAHHCSWHALSWDSWRDLGEQAMVSQDARNALSQALDGAFLIASSKPIKDDGCDPPSTRARREYEDIAKKVKGSFRCVGEYPSESDPEPMEFTITEDGPRLVTRAMRAPVIIGSGAIGGQPLSHG